MSIHINTNKANISKKVIMCGDPLRIKYIAENYLKDASLVSKTRLALVYTGYYQNELITLVTAGMGMPSLAIYAYELFKDFDVDKIIRVGTCGSYYEEIALKDIIVVEKSYTSSNFAYQYDKENLNLVKSSSKLNKKIIEQAFKDNISFRLGNINTSDTFYHEFNDPKIKENFCLGVEMECFALFYLALKFNKDAASILSVSDNLVTKEELSSNDREKTLDKAITLALNSLI